MATFVNNSSDNKSKVEIRAVSITDIPTRIAKKLLLEEEKKAKYDESGQAQLEYAKSIFEQNQVNSVSKLREAFGWLKKSVDANCYDAHLYIMECLNSIKNSTQLKIFDFTWLYIAYEYQFEEVIDFINYHAQNININNTLSFGIYLFIYQEYYDNIDHAIDIIDKAISTKNLDTAKNDNIQKLLLEICSNKYCFSDYNYFMALLYLRDNCFTIKDYNVGVNYLNIAIEQDSNGKAYNYMLSLMDKVNSGDADASITLATLIKSNSRLIKCNDGLADILLKYTYEYLTKDNNIDLNNNKSLAYLYEYGLGGKRKLKLARNIYCELSKYHSAYINKYKEVDEAITTEQVNLIRKIIKLSLFFIITFLAFIFVDILILKINVFYSINQFIYELFLSFSNGMYLIIKTLLKILMYVFAFLFAIIKMIF